MRWDLAIAVAGSAFLLGIVAVRDHSEMVRTGYRLSELETRRQALAAHAARARARVSELGSPASLALRAREIGLRVEFPDDYEVVRVGPGIPEGGPAVARSR